MAPIVASAILALDKLRRRWGLSASPFKTPVSSSPAVGVDLAVQRRFALVYVAKNKADSAKLHAIKSVDGKDKWTANFGETATVRRFLWSPARLLIRMERLCIADECL